MKEFLACIIASATLALARPSYADAQEQKPKVEVVKRGPDGRAEIVRIEGREYPVCQGDQKDGCINPRDAGLDWGEREIDYWPGKPASEIDKPLPAEKPANQE